jgi:hypothetical protein
MMTAKLIRIPCTSAVVLLLIVITGAVSQGFNRSAHVELFSKSVTHLKDYGLTDIHDFYTGGNSDSIDITFLADTEDEIMWVDIHSTTEPDENAAHHLINTAYPYCWNDSLEKLEDPEDVEACKECVRSVVDEFASIALPRSGQETVYFPSRGTDRSRYDFRWELPLSLLVGLASPDCDLLATRYGVLAENSLRSEMEVHSAKFKSLEYLNYAIKAWNDYDCETSLRWLTRLTNYDPHHSLAVFKSYDFLTEDWVSIDMDGDLDIDYDDSEAWNRDLLGYGIYYQVFFCDLVDARLGLVEPGSLSFHPGNIAENHSLLMDERASYSATLWSEVDQLMDYLNGNARDAVDDLLPQIVTSTAELLADFYYNVVDADHPEYILVCVEGIPKDLQATVRYELDFGDRAVTGTDEIRGEHFKYYEIPVASSITAENCVGCDTVMGYRFERMVICDGSTTYETTSLVCAADRATTVHLVYAPYWQEADRFDDSEDGPRAGQTLKTHGSGPPDCHLCQNSPNPASSLTDIAYSIPEDGPVSLQLYTVTGELVRTLVQGRRPAGHHTVRFDTRELAPGVYFYRLQAQSAVHSRKLLVLR